MGCYGIVIERISSENTIFTWVIQLFNSRCFLALFLFISCVINFSFYLTNAESGVQILDFSFLIKTSSSFHDEYMF